MKVRSRETFEAWQNDGVSEPPEWAKAHGYRRGHSGSLYFKEHHEIKGVDWLVVSQFHRSPSEFTNAEFRAHYEPVPLAGGEGE